MNALKKVLIWGIPALLLLAVLGIGFGVGWQVFFGPRKRAVTNRTFERTPQRVARGKYLVENVAGCMMCHSPVDPADPHRTKEGFNGAGNVAIPSGPGRIIASNITPDLETGIGQWTDDEIARAIREGVSRDGRTLFPMMPYANYREMSDDDVSAVVVYLRSLDPVRNNPGKTNVIVPVRYLIRTIPVPVTEPVVKQFANPVERGAYLVRVASCTDCHTTYDERRRPLPGMQFAGGNLMEEKEGTASTPNITPDETGIKGYTEASFREMMRTGMRAGRPMVALMPTARYTGQTDEDLNAIYAYLRTLKPVRHIIEPHAPATLCRVCNKEHGGGEKN